MLDNKLNDSVEVQSDAYRLKVVFSNLISNAIKYHDLAKDKPYILISCDKNHGYHINVEDNGIGIPEEHQSKIFDMFYRAHDRSEGSGLGLYIVKETLTKIGGQISVASEHGKGSTFSITLPLA